MFEHLPTIGFGHAPIQLNKPHTEKLNSTMFNLELNGYLRILYTSKKYLGYLHTCLRAYQSKKKINSLKQALKTRKSNNIIRTQVR